MGKFDNKVVIVTGASSGIGEAAAYAFAKEGAKLAISGRNADRLEVVAGKCKESGAEVLQIVVDLKDFENLELLITRTVERYGRLDILVNNAGFGFLQRFEKLEVGAYEKIFQVNLRAPVFLSKYALPHLKKTKGCIVNVSSVAALKSHPGSGAYSMTKAALDHFTRGLAAECTASGVRVNSINPAAVKTRFIEMTGVSKEVAEKMLSKYLTNQPFGVISPEQVADAILFLCESSMITGISLPIDGGQLSARANAGGRIKSRL